LFDATRQPVQLHAAGGKTQKRSVRKDNCDRAIDAGLDDIAGIDRITGCRLSENGAVACDCDEACHCLQLTN
jgi:hypothetical protein